VKNCNIKSNALVRISLKNIGLKNLWKGKKVREDLKKSTHEVLLKRNIYEKS